jgi:hypothetical protein
MALTREHHTSVTEATPVLALVGVTDLAVARVKAMIADRERIHADVTARLNHAQEGLQKAQEGLQKVVSRVDGATLRDRVPQLKARARDEATKVAGRVEARYADLAVRGRSVIERRRGQTTSDGVAESTDTPGAALTPELEETPASVKDET